jgi:4a-hydroxytetrahydrobiopterin dehydratase
VYNTVRVDLSTHDAGGITMFDVELAREFDALAG